MQDKDPAITIGHAVCRVDERKADILLALWNNGDSAVEEWT